MPALREQQIRLDHLDEADVGYLAAMIDAEGHISRKGRARGEAPVPGRWVIGVSNTHVGLIEWLVGLGGIVRPKGHHHSHRKPGYDWLVLARRDQIALLGAVAPHMRVKRERALEALSELLSLERNT